MKKLWTSMLALLLVFTLVFGALAEADVLADAVEEIVPEAEDYAIGAEDIEGGEAYADFVGDAEVMATEINGGNEEVSYRVVNGVLESISYANNKFPTVIEIPASVTYKDAVGNDVVAPITGIGNRLLPVWTEDEKDYTERDKALKQVTAIKIPAKVTSIGEGAFYGLSGLTAIELPAGLTRIGNEAFYGCTGLTSVVIPDSVTDIGYRAFEKCTGLTSVTLPANLSAIPYHMFKGCKALANVTIPAKVTSIGEGAFWGCEAITSFVIPDSVTGVGPWAFYGCKALTSVTFGDGVRYISSSDGYDADYKWDRDERIYTLVGYYHGGTFGGCPELTTVVFGKNVEDIDKNLFIDNPKLANVTVKGVDTRVYKNSFKTGTWLEEIKLTTASDSDKIDEANTHKYQTVVNEQGEEEIAYTAHPVTITAPCNSKAVGWAKTYGQAYVTNHTEETVPAMAATFYETGLTEGKRCSVCGEVLVAQLPTNRELHVTGKTTEDLKKGSVVQLIVDGKEVKSYKSSKKSVASVTPEGLVTAKKKGTAKITIKTTDKKKIVVTFKVKK